MREVRLAVLVVNYRTAALTLGCVESFVEQLDPGRDCAVVIDNASGGDSADEIETAIESRGWADRVRLIRSPLNGGFSAGHNIGLAAVRAEVYVLLNSDSIVQPGALQELYRASREHPDVGILGPRLEGEDGEVQQSAFAARTPIGEFLQAADTGPLSRLLRRFEVVLPLSQEPREVEWASFACVLLRRELIDQIGLLDDGYFMYFEDVDYSRRARKAGWKVLYWPRAVVVHLQGGSSPVHLAREVRKRPPAYFYAARSRYFAKAYGRAGLWLANLLWHLGRSVSLCREWLGLQRRQTCEREWRDIWHNAARPLSASTRPDPTLEMRDDMDAYAAGPRSKQDELRT